jgi:carbamoyl-phosphate synthase large subunit
MRLRKVLVLGSGPIKIAEAAEFDYSGSQALKALKEEGIKTIIINSNVATVQTSYVIADKVYLLPVSPEFIERVIEKERPDGIMIGFGGQTALNAGVDLFRSGTLKRYGVKVLGTGVKGIENALGRGAFKELMKTKGIETPPSMSSRSEAEALANARKLGYPIILRVSFNLGGRGSAVVWNEEQLRNELRRAFAQSRVNEVLLERHLLGWKEIEYEVVRDRLGNCAVTACIENLDPMGIHTGESVVITPSQTLDNYEYQMMRSVAIKVAEAIGLIGECNVQFALEPNSYKFYVIETNPRMSRSSALASKATGYPLAYVSAKLALGHLLYEIKNSVSKVTTACFEPSLDYVTVKMPRWDLDKFEGADQRIGTEMKSIGEVMSIGRNFEEAMQKAIRMLDIGQPGLVGGSIYGSDLSKDELEKKLAGHLPYWFLYAAKAFKDGVSVEHVRELIHIDSFFLNKIRDVVLEYEKAKGRRLGKAAYSRLKKLGFCDKQLRQSGGAELSVKQIDTLAGEWPAKTNYLYLTHTTSNSDIRPVSKGKLVVLGAGVFRIGVSVEFDYCSVALTEYAKKSFDEVMVLNCNPETVSTDWDRVQKLYFDEISEEAIMDICGKEKPSAVAVFAAGQIGNNLAKGLEHKGVRIFGTAGKSIEIAEDRNEFSKLLEKLGIKQPRWMDASSIGEIRRFVGEVGFPLLIRPSYVLSGSAMKVASNMGELSDYIASATRLSPEHPVVISKMMTDSIEAEMDCASDGRNVIGVTLQHVEEAGVHSGDATIFTPNRLQDGTYKKMKQIAVKLARSLDIRGPFNIQFIVKDGEPYVIELNLRASRSMPFSSKSVGIDLMDYSVRGIRGRYGWDGFYEPVHKSHAVKSAQFSWQQLKAAYPYLSPEMKSTGESASLGAGFDEALLKSWLGVSQHTIPQKAALVYGTANVASLSAAAKNLCEKIDVYTLEGAGVLPGKEVGIEKALELINKRQIDLVVTDGNLQKLDYQIRRKAADFNIPLILNGRLGEALSASFYGTSLTFKELKEYW